jgi:hypothetical protein
MPGVVRRSTRLADPHPLLGFGGRHMVESGVLLASVTTTTAGSSLDSGLYVIHRGLIVKKASSGGGSNNVFTPWAGTGTIFGVLARTVEFFDQSDISNADVPVWTGPGCVFNDQVLALYPGYTGNEAAFLTWAQTNGNRVGSQGGSY